MRVWHLAEFLGWAVAQPQNNVERDAQILQDFSRRVGEYVNVHNTVKSQIHRLKPTNSAEAIDQYGHRFARGIREARHGVSQGDIFTPEIAAEFRRLVGITMSGPEGARIRETLRAGSPVLFKNLRVNQSYPPGAALQTTPPSLLLNLPPLPPEVEYRLVGHALILRDIDANLIVDFVWNAVP
jgi:hypothetical protein